MSKSTKDLTPREENLLANAFQCIEGGAPKIDMKKLAAMAGYTEGSCRNAWQALKKKLEAKSNESGEGSSSIPSTPSSNKRKSPAKKKADADGDDDDEMQPETPAKKSCGRPPKKAKEPKEEVKVEVEGDEGDDHVEV